MKREGMTLVEARRQRLLAAMADAEIEHMVLYGNAWQGDYLRYSTDFGILEGHGIAIVCSDGSAELFLDSATETERAETETQHIEVQFSCDIARAVAARLSRAGDYRIQAAPFRFVPCGLMDELALHDGTAISAP